MNTMDSPSHPEQTQSVHASAQNRPPVEPSETYEFVAWDDEIPNPMTDPYVFMVD